MGALDDLLDDVLGGLVGREAASLVAAGSDMVDRGGGRVVEAVDDAATVVVLEGGGGDDHHEQQPDGGVPDVVVVAAVFLFAAFADGGGGCRPRRLLPSSRSGAWRMWCGVPLLQPRKNLVVVYGGSRSVQQPRPARGDEVVEGGDDVVLVRILWRGTGTGGGLGKRGLNRLHCRSVKSVG